MAYARIVNNQVAEYPIYDILQRYPNISFSQPFSVDQCPDEIVEVIATPRPEPTANSTVTEGTPEFISGTWYQTWTSIPSTQETPPQRRQREANIFAIYSQIIAQKLDNFARIKGYDNIAVACTYANSTIPRYKTEGELCVLMRDTYWNHLETLLAQIQADAIPAPNVQEFQENLPLLVWPE